MALIAGLILSLGLGVVAHPAQRRTAKFLLQLSIVLLGFGMDPEAVVRAGSSGVLLTAGSIAFTRTLPHTCSSRPAGEW